jgi:hypothetical protein
VSELFQVPVLFILALPIASIVWTITHEEVVREFRDICLEKSATCRSVYERKFFISSPANIALATMSRSFF